MYIFCQVLLYYCAHIVETLQNKLTSTMQYKTDAYILAGAFTNSRAEIGRFIYSLVLCLDRKAIYCAESCVYSQAAHLLKRSKPTHINF